MDVPADVLVEILLRLSPICRRRVRLVCRLWRDLIHERTPSTQIGPAKALIDTMSSTYVVDDLLGSGSGTPLWTDEYVDRLRNKYSVVGTCNGLICLCNNLIHGGPIALANPVTDEFLELPPVPGAAQFRRPAPSSRIGWHDTYSFAYHSVTGQYKIVHVPSCGEETVLKVYTLGEAAWRDVPIPANARCSLDAGLVCLDGATYWVTADDEKTVMAFDLEGERVTSTVSLPVASSTPAVFCHLAEVRGSLAAVISNGFMADEKIEVWILEGKRAEHRWSHRYNMQLPRPGLQECPNRRPGQRLTRPHLAHGMAILTHGTWYGPGLVRYEHTLSGPSGGAVQIHQWKQRRPLECNSRGRIHHTFAYTETTEPLIAYRLW